VRYDAGRMTDVSHEQRWGVYLVQAQNFAKRENYIDAVSRAGLVVDEVSQALAQTEDATARTRLSSMLLRATKLRDGLQQQMNVWNARIAKRRAAVIAGAAAEMDRQLPTPPPSRTSEA
jgi:hypothetical protein